MIQDTEELQYYWTTARIYWRNEEFENFVSIDFFTFPFTVLRNHWFSAYVFPGNELVYQYCMNTF